MINDKTNQENDSLKSLNRNVLYRFNHVESRMNLGNINDSNNKLNYVKRKCPGGIRKSCFGSHPSFWGISQMNLQLTSLK